MKKNSTHCNGARANHPAGMLIVFYPAWDERVLSIENTAISLVAFLAYLDYCNP